MKQRIAALAAFTALHWTAVGWSASPRVFDPFAGEAGAPRAQSRPAAFERTLPKAEMSTSVRNLGNTIDQVQFTDDPLHLVFQVVSNESGWSIFPGNGVKGQITLYARSITAGDLLDTAVRMAGFVYVKEGDIIGVMTFEDYMLHYGVTKRTFALQHRDAMQVAAVVTPFVTQRGKIVPDVATGTLVIYDTPTNIGLLEEIVRKIDLPADKKLVKVVKLEYAAALDVAEHLQGVFANEQKSAAEASIMRSIESAASQPSAQVVDALLSAEQGVLVHPVVRTNHLILRGYAADLMHVEELVRSLDAPEDLETRHYQIVHVAADEVLSSLEESLGVYSAASGRDRGRRGGRTAAGQRAGERDRSQLGSAERVRMSCLYEGNAIVVTAPTHLHQKVADILRLCDVPPPQIAGGIRYYRLQNAVAADVAKVLLDLINQGTQETQDGEFKLGRPGQEPTITGPSAAVPRPPAGAPAQAAPPAAPGPTPNAPSAGLAEGDLIGVAGERRTEKPRITFSESTNTVIIQATVQEQLQFAQLIKELDRQLPQVLIEAILVDLRGLEDIDVGVELENFGRPGDCVGRLLFTSFGLSILDPATGQRTLTTGPGGTAVITRDEDVPAIIHALQSTGKAKIRSAPRVLVNDNAQGLIQSIAEEPFSQVNASTTVATTSFGGFVQAGTQLRLVPHISNDDYLRLEYEITLNSFRGPPVSAELPPARDTSTVTSQATIPDGSTLIVAGLTYQTERETINSLPLIGDIPVLNLVFGRTISSQQDNRLYIFIRPTILRDSQFRQLKQISEQNLLEAREPSGYPESCVIHLEQEGHIFEYE